MENYTSRLNKVIDYIEDHLSEKLNLEQLSQIACFSPFHFHRLFSSFTGEPLYQFILRHRLEKSVFLMEDTRKTLTEISLACGFANSASFSKSFKSFFGTSPSNFRKKKSKIGQVERKDRKASFSDSGYLEFSNRLQIWKGGNGQERKVHIKDFPETTLAYIRHTGPYKGDAGLFQRLWNQLVQWAAPRELLNRPGVRFLALYHNSPDLTEEPKLRVSVALSVPQGTTGSDQVGIMQQKGGRYACTSFILGPEDYQEAWEWVYGTWLPRSGYIPGDGLAFEEFINEEKERLPKGKHLVEICLPIVPQS